MPGDRIALLIDAENVGSIHYRSIIDKARRLGDPIVRRIFGDFTQGRIAEWAIIARREGLETVCQVSGGKGKNSADIAMTIHAMDILHERRVDAFCVVSSDSDFLPLAIRIKSSGLNLHGMGHDRSDQALKNACTDFYVLDQVASPPRESVPAGAAAKQNSDPSPALRLVVRPGDANPIVALIRQILSPNGERGMHLPQLASAMRQLAPDLSKDFCRSGKFLKNLRSTNLVEEVNSGNSVRLRG